MSFRIVNELQDLEKKILSEVNVNVTSTPLSNSTAVTDNTIAVFDGTDGKNVKHTEVSIDSNHNVTTTGTVHGSLLKVNSYTVAALPSASVEGTGTIAHVTNDAGGHTLAVSDGSDWINVSDGNAVAIM